MTEEKQERVRFSTTLAPDVVEKLERMAPDHSTRNLNDVIEILVRKEWDDKYEVEKTGRHNERIGTGDGTAAGD